jgi:4-alpha-glucanotransferase
MHVLRVNHKGRTVHLGSPGNRGARRRPPCPARFCTGEPQWLTVSSVEFSRCSGVLLHITSLPGPYGIGDLGQSAYEFADFLAGAGQKLWQVLPLSPTGYGDSPYQGFSAFAGNPLCIDLETLEARGLLTAADLAGASALPQDQVGYGAVITFRLAVLRRAAEKFFRQASPAERVALDAFCRDNASWLDDYALFMACKDVYNGQVWTRWERGISQRQPAALQEWAAKLARELEVFKYWQFEFFQQWHKLKTYCHERGIRIMGDIPIYVAHDSADVWAHPDLFQLDEQGNPAAVAGVPPDYFCATGQLWGNPIYRWEVMADLGYGWWIDRFRASLDRFDMVRLDHFRGFEAYWEIPANAPTAVHGRWVKGPGASLFRALQATLGELPVVAENLGVVTPEVEALRKEFGFPGMSLLQFAFGYDPQGPSFRPHNYSRELVAYTGGHDNDTTLGWWTSSGVGDSTRTPEEVRKEHAFTRAYLGFENEEINWVFIRAVFGSVASIAVVPLQDVLGLGSEARMNLPGTIQGNWTWRYSREALTEEIRDRLRALTRIYDR